MQDNEKKDLAPDETANPETEKTNPGTTESEATDAPAGDEEKEE